MDVTFEIFPSKKLKLDALPEGWEYTITCTARSLEPTIETYRRLGPRHTPHISAALIESEGHLESVAQTVTRKVFLIGGDPEPQGPYMRSAQLIPHFRHCEEIGVAGYPEGHPNYPDESFGDKLLLEKQRLGATYTATQMCFDSQAIIDWIQRIRDKGLTLPILAGVAVPVNIVKLARFAARSGVNASVSFLRKTSTRDVACMIQRYDPRPLMEAVHEHVDGFHIYTFNSIQTTRRWVGETPWLAAAASTVDNL